MTVTVKHPFVSTVPDSADTSLVRPSNWNADHTIVGLGTAAELNAGVANGVATLDGGGTVPLSQIPASIQGTLSYQGTWNASTNTPTLASGVGTKGYYYVVSVAGSTNLDGITDWNVGDMAVYSGTAWQQIDNTDAVTSVNGYTGTVVLNAADVGALATITSSDGSIDVSTVGTAVDLTVSVNSPASTLIGQVRNETGATLTRGTVVYISGAAGNKALVSKALATSDATSAQTYGVITADIPNNQNGYATIAGSLGNLNTSAYTDGTQLYLSSTTAGDWTSTKQYAPNHLVYVGVVTRSHVNQGTIEVKIQNGYEMDELHNVSAQTPSNGNVLIWNNSTQLWESAGITAGTGISVTNGAGSITVTNTAPSLGGDVVGPASATDNAVARYDGTTGKLIQNSAVTIGDDGATVIAVNSLSAALRITQTGAGNALLVEDSANPDATPFVVNASGQAGFGVLAPNVPVDAQAQSDAIAFRVRGRTADNIGDIQFTDTGASTAYVNLRSPAANTFAILTGGSERMRIDNRGAVGIGSTALTTVALRLGTTITGGTTAYGAYWGSTVQPSVTSSAIYNQTFAATAANGAVPYTVGALRHYSAGQSTFNADSTVTTQIGFAAESTITGATNNYGFWGNIASGSNRWNFYAAGTAANYLAGGVIINNNLGVGAAGSPSYGTSGQVLTSAGSGAAPTWSTPVSSNITAQGLFENANTISANYTIGTNNNAVSAGPITVASGVTVTVPSGSVWTIV
jgi:hypothetical protein